MAAAGHAYDMARAAPGITTAYDGPIPGPHQHYVAFFVQCPISSIRAAAAALH